MIYLMRHSQAVRGGYLVPDDSRWLTTEGRVLALEAGRALCKQVLLHRPIDCIVSSPCTRAVQTAELVAQTLGWNAAISTLESIRSEASPQQAIEDLLAFEHETILVVCHEPIVSSMGLLLLEQSPVSLQNGFRTAEIRAFANAQSPWCWRG